MTLLRIFVIILFLCINCFFLCINYIFGVDEGNKWQCNKNGHEIIVGVGWKNVNAKLDTYDFIIEGERGEIGCDKGNLVGANLAYKYQVPKKIYARVSGSYYWGNLFNDELLKEFSGDRSKFYQLHADGALGYTFAFSNNKTLISPFLSLNWQHDVHEFKSNFGGIKLNELPHIDWDNSVKKTTTRYGFIGMVGVDIRHVFKQRIEGGIIFSIGLPLFLRERFVRKQKDGDDVTYEGQTFRKMDIKSAIFYELLVPVHFCWKKWKFGLELSHSRKVYKSSMHRIALVEFGAAVDAIRVF